MPELMECTIAVIMTCHDRREKTLACLATLLEQGLPAGARFEVYLVDDGSTDGTTEAVGQSFPEVKIIQGNGGLFWNGGMRKAFAEAMESNPSYYLWLNDDTTLYPEAVAKLLSTYRQAREQGETRSVVVGSTCDPDTGNLSYGGMVRSNWWHPLKFKLLQPGDEPQPCQTMNGNCVLIPREVAQLAGNLELDFIHSSGDMDYGLRVRQKGGSVWLAPGYIGTCQVNSLEGNIWDNPDLTIWERLKLVNNPKNLPMTEWKVFARRHAGPLWPFYWSLPYIRLIFGAIFGGKTSSGISR